MYTLATLRVRVVPAARDLIAGGLGSAAPDPARARVAVGCVFFLNGVGVGSWVVRIPDVQRSLGLSTGALGLALLGAAAGAVIAMPIAGRLVTRFGSRRVAVSVALAYALTLTLPTLAGSLSLLVLALLANGAANGSLNVSLNAHASLIGRRLERPILASFHAMFSGGGLAGAASGGVIAAAGVGAPLHLAGVASTMIGVALVARRWLLPASHDHAVPEGGGRGVPHRPTARVALLGLLAFVILFAEGSMGDWSAVYLRDVVGAGAGQAASGYAAFSVMMLLGRVVGDRMTARWGASRVVTVGGSAAALGVALAVLVPGTVSVALGFGAVGAGLATAFPSVLGAASRVDGTTAGDGIAAVATLGYFGLLAGPPVIGLLAQASSLRGGMVAVGVACVLTALLARSLHERAAS